MERKVYLQNDIITLSEYIDSEDDINCYTCWLDEETQNGYNYKMTSSFEEYTKQENKARFINNNPEVGQRLHRLYFCFSGIRFAGLSNYDF